MPPPTKEHAWFKRYVGEWDSEVEMFMAPNQPPMKSSGTERARMLGGFWLISEGGNNAMPYSFLLQLGYDPQRQKYIGSWVDSMTSYNWTYEGTVDSTGNILSLNTEGPFPPPSGPVTKIKEVTEFKSDDLRVFTSSRLEENGQWTTHLRVTSRRKK